MSGDSLVYAELPMDPSFLIWAGSFAFMVTSTGVSAMVSDLLHSRLCYDLSCQDIRLSFYLSQKIK